MMIRIFSEIYHVSAGHIDGNHNESVETCAIIVQPKHGVWNTIKRTLTYSWKSYFGDREGDELKFIRGAMSGGTVCIQSWSWIF